jgi:hypothetical protein
MESRQVDFGILFVVGLGFLPNPTQLNPRLGFGMGSVFVHRVTCANQLAFVITVAP